MDAFNNCFWCRRGYGEAKGFRGVRVIALNNRVVSGVTMGVGLGEGVR